MFIQEPFWKLTLSLPKPRYIGINNQYNFLPKEIEDIAKVLADGAAGIRQK